MPNPARFRSPSGDSSIRAPGISVGYGWLRQSILRGSVPAGGMPEYPQGRFSHGQKPHSDGAESRGTPAPGGAYAACPAVDAKSATNTFIRETEPRHPLPKQGRRAYDYISNKEVFKRGGTN